VRHLRLVIEYDGTDFAGWQRQASDPTVQATIEDALAIMVGHPVTLRGAGRTDAGVHARGQVATFSTASQIPVLGFLRGLNTALPRTIAISAVDEAPADFDARRWAIGKHYIYRIWNREARAALLDRTAWHVHTRLDHDAMHAAAQALLGEHDFSAFRAVDCDAKQPVRTLHRVDVSRDGHLITIDVEGTAFLRNMVRIIVGSLEDIGRGRRRELATALASRDRAQSGRTAPPKGLCLERVIYGEGRPPHLLLP
jgi:tRNA pseudouridine38-40 synthase